MSDELNEQMNNMSVFEENFTRTDYDSSSSSIDDDSKKTMIEDRIILNVGGIKYETFRSTLTAYPDTLLGIMFSERNKEMLHPTNVNEYFFDRDGYIFRYILQYYRTGQVHWPEFSSPYQVNNSSIDLVQGVTKTFTSSSPSPSSNNLEGGRMDNLAGFGGTSCPTLPFTRAELEQELLFFLIPTKSDDDLIESLLHEETSSINSTQSLTFANKAVVDNVNGFLYALKEVMYCVASLFEKKIMITFYHDRQQPVFKLIPPNPNIIVNELAPFNEKIKSILIPYAGVGYTLLMNFENEIEAWMKEEIKELKWTMEKPGGLPNRFVLHLNFNDKFLKQQILKNSLLAKVINNNNNNNNNINNSNVGGSSSGSGSGIGIGLGIGNGSGNGNGIGSSYSNTVSGPPPMMVPTSNHSSATSGIGNTLGNGSTTNFSS